ncbi:hypothetical protein RJ639_004661, partial [Escallonia herrerae]
SKKHIAFSLGFAIWLSAMADFQTSTHRAKWIFSPQELKEKYKAANQRAKEMLEKVPNFKTMMLAMAILLADELLFSFSEISYTVMLIVVYFVKYGTTRIEVDIDGSLSYPEPQHDAKAEKHSRTKPLKTEEEHLLRAFYEFKIQDVCDAFKFPRKIQATALLYFKRFYLLWSVMEHHPKHIMLTCIYTACKAEENHVSAEELGKGIEQDHQMILNNEMIVLQAWIHKYISLGFDLIVYAPYRSIDGFINDIEDYFQTNDGQLPMLKVVVSFLLCCYSGFNLVEQIMSPIPLICLLLILCLLFSLDLQETAKMEADKTMLTEAPLLFPPGQLALAALRRSNKVHGILDFESYLGSILSRHHPTHSNSELASSLNAIDSVVSKLVTPTAADMKHIDRKLKSCRDPGSHDK